jgi:site-specific recombinase XerD
MATMTGAPRLMTALIYSTGLRMSKCAILRVKDFDFYLKTINVRAAKDNQDRSTPLPHTLVADLRNFTFMTTKTREPISAAHTVLRPCLLFTLSGQIGSEVFTIKRCSHT